MNKRLLVVGSNTVHTYTFIELIQDYFDEVILLTNQKRHKVSFEVIEVDFSLKSISSILKIKHIAKRLNPTHIHIHQANSYAFLTLVALGNIKAKKVLNAWGSDILLNPQKNFILRQIVKYNLKHADVVVADSDTVLDAAKSLVSNIKTVNINFGIDFIECNRKKENIIYSNRLHKKLYNIDKIIISFSKFIKNNRDWKLVIAGNGSETSILKALVSTLGIDEYVKFIGFVDKKTNFEYYCKSKIYVSIPSSDSISLSLIEAITSGCIVFVSELDANKEIIDNRVGFIVEDSQNIAFEKYNETDMTKQRERNLELKKYFSKEYNKKRYIEIYEN